MNILQDCTDIFGEDEYVIVARSYVRSQFGDYERAISDLERLLSKGTDNRQAYGMLSGFLADVKHDYERALTILEEAYPKFSDDDWLINNLAYAHLMLGHTQAARVLLERKAVSSKTITDVALMATHGLLYLREGNLAKAREFYKSSATLASQLGHKELAVVVRQKMHLELACDALRKRDTVAALHEIDLGLGVGKGSPNYRNDLLLLSRRLHT